MMLVNTHANSIHHLHYNPELSDCGIGREDSEAQIVGVVKVTYA